MRKSRIGNSNVHSITCKKVEGVGVTSCGERKAVLEPCTAIQSTTCSWRSTQPSLPSFSSYLHEHLLTTMPDSTPPSDTRFASSTHTAEDLLKEQTVGLVHLSDFRKRRAEALEQSGGSGASTPTGNESRYVRAMRTAALLSNTIYT